MKYTCTKDDIILIAGTGKLTYSIVTCLMQAGHPVSLITEDRDSATAYIREHWGDLSDPKQKGILRKLEVQNSLRTKSAHKIAIAVTDEDVACKRFLLEELENILPSDAIIAINNESFRLTDLQKNCQSPERVIGLNWAYPAHTTFFLELNANEKTDQCAARALLNLARTNWNKDPYVISNDLSIRAKMFSAMAREAFFLVENGYASIEDIDRACRNDPGYYLPFAGNCRYIDLMGTYAYGIVMKGLNPELSKDSEVAHFMKTTISEENLGMENGKGFYEYENGDSDRWNEIFRKFSVQIHEIIKKYPFDHKNLNSHSPLQ
ncbi:MAG: 3-hydroxyacyl-CoA dehydrogenase [Chitinophagaceae bacterium]|nr:3-hydroxyacyl-CoA dehydrogenase [Chitinophagaceae bacterium]